MHKRPECIARLIGAGISETDAYAIRRAAMTLTRWFELECGTGEGQTTYSIERDGDEPDSKPYRRVQYPTLTGYVDRRYAIADRETGARKALTRILSRYPAFACYIQGDPRGHSVFIIRPGDVREGQDVDSYYSNGIAVYK